jgi:chemotaxis protein MotA
MDKATLLGIGSGLVLVYGAIFIGDGWEIFFDLPSAVIVFGGTAAVMFVTFSPSDLRRIPVGTIQFLTHRSPELYDYLDDFSEFSRVARREGLLALDRRLDESDDDFVRFGLEMAVDGIEEAEIDEMMKMRMMEEAKKRQLIGKFYTNAGTYAPAFGMIGTLIGLIQMMQNMNDPSKIGAGMAVALITTFYGAMAANLIFLPMATKVNAQIQEVLKARQMVRTGVLAIVRGESPSMIEKRLVAFLGEDLAEPEESAEERRMARAA